MTPEEAAVINAAIAMMRVGHEPTVPELNVLRDAAWRLITTCQQCNTETHTCPGCGAWLPHAGPAACEGCQRDIDGISQPAPPWAPQERPVWMGRTWQDVRTGDHVRMPGTDVTATIEMRYLHPSQDQAGTAWHVVSAGSGKFAHTKDHIVQPGECVVLLAGESHPRFMNPVAPVEIELTPEEIRVAEQLGWENRLQSH